MFIPFRSLRDYLGATGSQNYKSGRMETFIQLPHVRQARSFRVKDRPGWAPKGGGGVQRFRVANRRDMTKGTRAHLEIKF